MLAEMLTLKSTFLYKYAAHWSANEPTIIDHTINYETTFHHYNNV